MQQLGTPLQPTPPISSPTPLPHPHPSDHADWGRPEEQGGPRPAYTWGPGRPASDAAGAAASALAATSLLLRASDPSYAAACLDHARSLFALASQVGLWSGGRWSGEGECSAGCF